MREQWDDFLNYPFEWSPRRSHRLRSRPPPMPRTLGEARRTHLWLWARCRRTRCYHFLAMPLVPLIIRFGTEASLDVLREGFRCSECGGRGALIGEPSRDTGDRRCIREDYRWTGLRDWHPQLGGFSVEAMCNAYSMTKSRDAIRALFKVSDNRMPRIIPPLPEIWPFYQAPIVRNAEDGEREVTMATFAFPLERTDRASKPVTNIRDDKAMKIWFWRESFNARRCLVPATSYCDPDEATPVAWHWFAVEPAADRPLFACPGVWKSYKGKLRKKDPEVETDVFAFMTTKPNALSGTINHERMPVIFTEERQFDIWLNGTPEEAHALVHSFPADKMRIVQSGKKGPDLLGEAA